MSEITLYPGMYCVYRHVVAGVVIYVGQGKADRPFNMKHGGRSKAWHKTMLDIDTMKIEIVGWFGTRTEACHVERKEIIRLNPTANLSIPATPVDATAQAKRYAEDNAYSIRFLREERADIERIGRMYARSIGKEHILENRL